MQDDIQTLKQQVEMWESREAEAQRALQVARRVLPDLRESLRELTAPEAPPPEEPDPPSEQPGAGSEDSPEDSQAQSLRIVRRAEDIVAAVTETLPDLATRFTQGELEAAMLARGYTVNTSTLRGNLKTMAQLRQGFTLAEQGIGRRATVFEKVEG